MFVSLAILAGRAADRGSARQAARQVEQPRAPIEQAGPLWAAACNGSDDWHKPAPPVRIHGNTYLVGTCGISSILITDPAGDMLIDGGTEARRRPHREQYEEARLPAHAT